MCAPVRTLVTLVLTLVCFEPVSSDLININFIDYLCLTHLHPNFITLTLTLISVHKVWSLDLVGNFWVEFSGLMVHIH